MTTPFPAQIKLTLAPDTDTDPPTNAVWVRDNLIGINPPMVLVKDLPSPQDFGAVGDGVEDDTVAYQEWLTAIAGRTGYGAAGTFLISDTLTIGTGTTVQGSGRATHVIKKADSFPAARSVLTNDQAPSQAGTYSNSDIALYGVYFDGSSLTTSAAMISMAGVSGLILRDCQFGLQHFRCVQIAGCRDVVIESNRFFDWGRREADHSSAAGTGLRDGGAAIQIVAGVVGSSSEVTIASNHFYDAQWGGIFTTADRIAIFGNHFANLLEYGVRAQAGDCVTVSGNHFVDIHTNDVTAFGVGAVTTMHLVVADNTMDQMGLEGVRCVNGEDTIVCNNVIHQPQRDVVPSTGGGIALVSAGDGNGIVRANVSDNIISDETGQAAFGILLQVADDGTGNGDPLVDVLVQGNVMSGTTWLVTAIGRDPDHEAVIGERTMIRDNLGTSSGVDLSRHCVSFIVPSGTSGVVNIGGVGFQASSIDFRAVSTAVAGLSIGAVETLTVWDITTQSVSLNRQENTNTCVYWANDGTDAVGTVDSTRCIHLAEADDTDVCIAALTAMTEDGFVLTLDGPTTESVVVFATCHA